MRFSLPVAALLALFTTEAVADFDVWQQTMWYFQGSGIVNSYVYYVSAPAYSDQRCSGRVQDGLPANLCNMEFVMDGTNGFLRDCNENSVHNAAEGAYIGRYKVRDGEPSGPCYVWRGGSSSKSCSGFPEVWKSKIACKVQASGH